ncbi:MAG: creatininase family protein [Pseudomonadota bacterium]|nr:creatininase family protein [Pseudomonadota bacterium]
MNTSLTSHSMSPAERPQPRHWGDLRTVDFAALDPHSTVAVLPVSATEQHGPHLPLSTDAVINDGVLREAIARLPLATASSVLVLPPLAVGDSLEHSAFAGTVSIDSDALMGTWLSIGRSVARAGVRKLVIFNTHGGQKAHVDLVALRLRVECRMLVVRAHSFGFGVPQGLFDADERAHGIHGGAVETSLLLHLRPDLVHVSALKAFPSLGQHLVARGGPLAVEKPIGFGWMAQDLNPEGVCGDATQASADKGAAVLDHMAAGLANLLQEAVELPLDTLRNGPLPNR